MSARAEQRIFISYRRSDCQSQANGLHDGLRHRLPESRVFMDIDSIPPGADFEEHIRGEIEQCDVVLVLIGDDWLAARPGMDARRIDEANDFVRLEIESSLAARHLRVIPLLVEGASMPTPEELPESIQRLARLNAFELSDQRWSTDIERLTQQLRQFANPTAPATADSSATMSFADVDDAALRYAMSTLTDTFKTKDLSEHPAMLATHTEVSQLRNYHTIIGRYLMQNRAGLGLQEPAKPVDDRGSVWVKRSGASTYARTPISASAPARPVAQRAVASAHAPTPAPAPAPERKVRSAKFMVWLCILTVGLGAWAAPLWAANRRSYDSVFRGRMRKLAAVLGLAALAGFLLVGTAPTDAEGSPTGAASDLGTALMFLVILVGVVVTLVYRHPQVGLPGTEAVLARRDSRERYRQLIERDRSLASSMFVGRPDVARDYDDGGLLDLNSLSPEAISAHGWLNREEAAKIVEVRGQLRRYVDMNEVLAYVDLSETTATRLKDVAVFV